MELNFKKANGLIPAIIQDFNTGEILMLGFMNKEAFDKTKSTKLVHFYSRSRQKLWLKGEESDNKLKVKEILTDCDNDSLLVKVELIGLAVCHTGARSCFKIYED